MNEHALSLNISVVGGPLLWRLGLQALLNGQPSVGNVTQSSQPTNYSTLSDVVLLDGGQTDAFLPQLTAHFPATHILIIADQLSPSSVMQWMGQGAQGCIDRNASLPDLLSAIRQIATGEVSLPPPVAVQLVAQIARQSPPTDAPLSEPLSAREQEVLSLLAQGLSNKAIAQRLYLSVRTVEGHLANIYGKLGVHSRTEAALFAVQQRNTSGP